MAFPGFTGEASVYRSSEWYRQGALTAGITGNVAIPQQHYYCYPCTAAGSQTCCTPTEFGSFCWTQYCPPPPPPPMLTCNPKLPYNICVDHCASQCDDPYGFCEWNCGCCCRHAPPTCYM
jgi:hypothetical protein